MARRIKFNARSGAIIGLTGGIATGKSHILSCFKRLGFKVYDTDKAVHELFKKGNDCFEAIKVVFPNCIGKLKVNRKKLAAEVLTSKSKLQILEKIVHPIVRNHQEKFKKVNKGHSIVFEVPLLFENKRERHYDYVVSAFVADSIQKKRSKDRKGMTTDKLDAILARQVSKDVHFKKADFIIDTKGTKQQTFKKVKELIEDE